MTKDNKENPQHKYIVEFIVMGKSVKVTAFDQQTLKEVSIVGDRKAGKETLSRVAIRKLQYMQKKDKGEE